MDRRIVFLFLSFLIILSTTPSYADNEGKKTIRIAGDRNFPPYEYLSKTGVYSGFNVDVMNAISIQTGIKFEFVPMPWNQAIQALNDGKVDAIQGMKYSAARDKIYDFSKSYFTSVQAIFVRKDNVRIRALQDLKNTRVAVQKGDIAQELLKEDRGIKLVEVNNQQEAISLLSAGEVDAFVGNQITGQYFAQLMDKQDNIKIVGEPLHPEAYGVVVLPKNKQLLTTINEGIDAIKKDGTYDKIQRKWFGEEILSWSTYLEKWLFWIKIAVLIAGSLFIGILWWNRQLKREVGKRTLEIEKINKQLQEKMLLLQENLSFQQQLVDSAYSCFMTLDQNGNIAMYNQKAQELLQMDTALIGQSYQMSPIVQFIPTKQIEQTFHQVDVYLQQEVKWRRNGEKRMISYSLFPHKNQAGESIGVILNFSDITGRKELERQMAESNRLRALGQLVLGIAHEIRNPLTSILTYAQLLPKKMDNKEFCQLFSEQITVEITRLNDLVGDLLNFAHPRRSTPTSFRLLGLVESILLLLKQQYTQKELIVSTEIPPDCEVFADRQQLQQILLNMIINAIQALSAGGHLIIRAKSEGSRVLIEIEDDGCGMEEADMEKIFEPFYTKKNDGVGLGLAISYQLIKENNGTIQVKSQLDEGTTFSLFFPNTSTKKDGITHVSSHDY
ncbi:transporter substrate-binding domain-containing protein [Shimazuella sp. AN120528]|uniref:transporter substrate-binding domain-containing protein n=1 Tax=Shimazuella soli TaxID=1892854 RepID=UPI001F101416|nr:transporter substrate-binding domain-containing protein [Shimazuella soli]MCH5584891.1 transporter substrate-binding domain-containing protein [Shimazuella soli]